MFQQPNNFPGWEDCLWCVNGLRATCLCCISCTRLFLRWDFTFQGWHPTFALGVVQQHLRTSGKLSGVVWAGSQRRASVRLWRECLQKHVPDEDPYLRVRPKQSIRVTDEGILRIHWEQGGRRLLLRQEFAAGSASYHCHVLIICKIWRDAWERAEIPQYANLRSNIFFLSENGFHGKTMIVD